MNHPISSKVTDKVKGLLPALRESIKKEFVEWNGYAPAPGFYSDEKVLETLPAAAYEYLIITWGIPPARIDKRSVVYVMDNRLFNDMDKITAHALRRLAPITLR